MADPVEDFFMKAGKATVKEVKKILGLSDARSRSAVQSLIKYGKIHSCGLKGKSRIYEWIGKGGA